MTEPFGTRFGTAAVRHEQTLPCSSCSAFTPLPGDGVEETGSSLGPGPVAGGRVGPGRTAGSIGEEPVEVASPFRDFRASRSGALILPTTARTLSVRQRSFGLVRSRVRGRDCDASRSEERPATKLRVPGDGTLTTTRRIVQRTFRLQLLQVRPNLGRFAHIRPQGVMS